MSNAPELSYFRERLRNRIHDLMLESFHKEAADIAELSRKMNKRPEQIAQILGAPGNLTLETISDFFLALGLDVDVSTAPLAKMKAAETE